MDFEFMSLRISINPSYVFRLLCIIIVLLTIMSTLAIILLYFYRWPQESAQFRIVKIFWLDAEGNMPPVSGKGNPIYGVLATVEEFMDCLKIENTILLDGNEKYETRPD